MNFEEFRTLSEKYRNTNTQPEILNELFKEIKNLPLNKIFNVNVNIFRKNIKDFFQNKYNTTAGICIGVLDLYNPPIAHLTVYVGRNLRFELGELVKEDMSKYDLTRLLGGLSRVLSHDIKKFMSYEGIEDVLWATIKENYNIEKENEIGLIRKRINENLKTIEKINAPDYVKTTTDELSSKIDEDNQKLQQILDSLDSID